MNTSAIKDFLSKLSPYTTPAPSKPRDHEGNTMPNFEALPVEKKVESKPYQKVVSVFADDMMIEGSLTSQSDIIVRGHVLGNVTSLGSVELRGTVDGDVCGRNVSAFQAQVNGNIKAEEHLSIQDSVINGDLFSQSGDINSVVNGNIVTNGLLVIKKSSSIRGNITAVSVSIEKDAVLEGKMTVQQK